LTLLSFSGKKDTTQYNVNLSAIAPEPLIQTSIFDQPFPGGLFMRREPLQAKEEMTRRQFLVLSGWLALGATTLASPLAAAAAARFDRELYGVTGGRICMGTFVNMALFDPSKDHAQEAMEKAFDEMSRIINILNCHDNATPISFLNRTGSLRELPPELYQVLSSSLQFHTATAGAFDITIKPVLELYRESFEKYHNPPEPEQVREALDCVGSQNIELSGDRVAFRNERMGVTLDGIAKGYIVDRTMDVLRSSGIKHALINAGGDICVIGSRGDGKPWRIGVQDPVHRDKCLETIEMIDGAIATSGNYEVYFDREKLYHHIITPKLGRPASGASSVSVIASNTMTADALSTSAFVMGVGQGTKFLRSMSGIGGLIVSVDQRRFSANWPTKA
jgi:FAD:protein FMN transferase